MDDARRNEWMAALVASAGHAVLALSGAGRIEYANAACATLFGRPIDTLVGRAGHGLVPPGLGADFDAKVRAVADGAAEARLRYDLRGEGLELRHVELQLAPIRGADGSPDGVSIIAHDVTDDVRAEQRFRVAVEAAPSGIVMVDASGSIVLANTEMERMFGFEHGQLLGRSIDELVPVAVRGQHHSYRSAFVASPESRSMGRGRDLFGVRADGEEFPVEVGLNPIEFSDGIRVLGTVVDITERKRITQQLAEKAEDLARSNEELEQFAYIASHDLQEPLRTVASYTDLLSRRYADALDDEGREFLSYARAGALRMRDLIHALLEYSRARGGYMEIEPIDARDVVDAAIHDLRRALDAAGAEVECSVDAWVMGNGAQLTLVFQNLVANAIKFVGDVQPSVQIQSQREGEMVRFDVVDNGIGIDPAQADRIFEMFQRLHTREAYPGTGLGLALCRRIVLRHGGTMWVEPADPSGARRGSRFSFTVPAALPDAQ